MRTTNCRWVIATSKEQAKERVWHNSYSFAEDQMREAFMGKLMPAQQVWKVTFGETTPVPMPAPFGGATNAIAETEEAYEEALAL
ncbi:MAG: hypothetical protein SGI92_30580 [Bryobacteraceae bacterium]|nr:hypothetical protein [Bryobacteraceae bacterium]